MAFKGFVLQSTYRIENRKPVIHLYGRLIDGRTFLVKESRRQPSFYVYASQADCAELANEHVQPADLQTFDGQRSSRVTKRTPADVVPLRDRLHQSGRSTFEADIPFATTYLIENDIKGGVEIVGQPVLSNDDLDLEFLDPDLKPCEVEFEPTCLSIDIETDPDAKRLLAISLYNETVDEVFICDPANRAMPSLAIGYASEKETLDAFVTRVHELDPDVITGWNVVDFDLSVMQEIAQRNGCSFELGRTPGRMTIREATGYFGSGRAQIPGRVVLDGIDLIRGAFMRFPEYSLEVVSQSVLGEGKQVEGDVHDRAGEILQRFDNDLEGFASYARTDARLAFDIVRKLDLLQLAKVRSTLTGMPLDRVAASVASFDFVYISALRKRNICAPSLNRDRSDSTEPHAGGEVLSPKVGIHPNVWVLDFKSLYPSIIRTFNIDPLGYRESKNSGDHIKLLNDAEFDRGEAILPRVLDELFKARENAKKNNDSVASQAIKILMNSFYGVLATPVCRFHNSRVANAITTMGRHFLLWSKQWFSERGFDVLYGDTDSVFVHSGIEDGLKALKLGEELTMSFNDELQTYIQTEWQVASKLELEFEKLYTQLFLLPLKRGSGGARKRYAGRLHPSGEVEFVGMEVVRRDWTELAKDAQRELYARLFKGESVEDYVSSVIHAVRNGSLDEKLVYTKGLSKEPERYTKVKPPHVVAALKSKEQGRVVHYVMTVDGPEPVDELHHKIDREHYIEKQLRAVAEPVIETLGVTWEHAAGIPVQRSLFESVDP